MLAWLCCVLYIISNRGVFLFMGLVLNSDIMFMKNLNIVIFYGVQSLIFLWRM